MVSMKFTKMHGCGNDYVYVDCTQTALEQPEEVARRVSDRHFGIGSDGLILICPSQVADFRMRMFNADGSEGAMCGNGIRCVGKFVYDKGLTAKTSVDIETRSGIKHLALTVENGKVSQATVHMGTPSLAASSLPVIGMGETVVEAPVTVAGRTFSMTCVSMGNPHAILWVEDVQSCGLEEIGPLLENHPMFPDRCNIEFVQLVDDSHVKMRVWERGSGETLACGTGACASAFACYHTGKTGSQVDVELLGGTLHISVAEDGHIDMTGPATTVFEGEIE
jgi:diaminopimelate epimerase